MNPHSLYLPISPPPSMTFPPLPPLRSNLYSPTSSPHTHTPSSLSPLPADSAPPLAYHTLLSSRSLSTPLVSSLPVAGPPPTPTPFLRLPPLPAPPFPHCQLFPTDYPFSDLTLIPPSRPTPPTRSAPSIPGPSSIPMPSLARPPPLECPSLAGNILGNHTTPTAFHNDPSLIYIGLDDMVKYWTCALCDFTCGAALDNAMDHIQSDLHATRVKASVRRPAAREAIGPWRALTLLKKAPVAAFLHGRA
ncbi:unnamed protein product [Closterium sp. Naga37s-1]|nr:unnamed protein product [Closterium sp. Naga37s-1]